MTKRDKQYTHFVGIDVSRNKLDAVVMRGKDMLYHKEFANENEAIKSFIVEVRALKGFTVTKAVFTMEQTGIYCNPLLLCLQKIKGNIVLDGALQIKNSLGNIRGKNDKLDATRIAEYAYRCREHLRLWVPKRQAVVALASLVSLRNRLLGLHIAINVPLKEQSAFVNKGITRISKQLCSRSLIAIKTDLTEIEGAIAKLLNEDVNFNRLMKIITSVPSIGPVTATYMIICTNEFRDIRDPKKFACYSGIAPFPKESGTVKGRSRVSHMANKKMKALLHTCAVVAVRTDKELKEYFERKTVDEGKHKMMVLNAIRNKLTLRVFACVNQDRLFQTVYFREDIEHGAINPINTN